MKKILAILISLLMLPMALGISIGDGITPDIITEDFEPLVWLCGHRVVFDDATEPGRISDDGEKLVERINNYAFEGEQISWLVLVMDKNGIEKIKDVYATVGDSQGEGNYIEVNCDLIGDIDKGVKDSCNARILEEEVEWDSELMAYYMCTFTVETPGDQDLMYGEYWITVEAVDLDGEMGTMDENEYWFLNPVIGLSIEGDMTFDGVRPGASSYSETILVGNDADDGSGVMLDMFISGTDFYDSSSSGAMCPDSNTLELSNFAYYATNGAYSTRQDEENDFPNDHFGAGVERACDDEAYCNIEYGIGFNNPHPFYDNAEILQAGPMLGPYYMANVLAPEAEMAITFRLDLPEPCNGDFDTGSIYFWGEAI